MSFWSDIVDEHTGPELTDALIDDTERVLGYRLPGEYLRVMWLRNGGYPARPCFPTNTGTSWAPDHLQITTLHAIQPHAGIGRSPELVRDRRYPPVGVVIADTASGTDDAVMLDYSQCGPQGEPRVVYVEPGSPRVIVLAPHFRAFAVGLVHTLPEPPDPDA